MIYADYEYYAGNYMGRLIKEDDFQRFAVRASRYIDYITLGRAQEIEEQEPIKMCCCALAEMEQQTETAQELAQSSLNAGIANGAEIQSETVGSLSRSYRAGGSSAQAAAEAAAATKEARAAIAREYLTHTGVFYRGAGRRCR